MQTVRDTCVLQTLKGFHEANITVIEWETQLLSRLGYPLASKYDLIFLIPDEQIQQASEITADSGLKIAVPGDLPTAYLSEFAHQGFRYIFGEPKHRFILVPLTWTGIDQDEIEAVSSPQDPERCTIFTVPLPVFCAACLRIITQETSGSRVRVMAIADLSNVIAYSMFDMSYDGDYLINAEDDIHDEAVVVPNKSEDDLWRAEKDALEMRNALRKIQGWRFKKDDEWTRETLLRLVSGELLYEDLPSK